VFPLRISRKVGSAERRQIRRALENLPPLTGDPIWLCFSPALKVSRGRLLSGDHHPGTPVHAAAFVRQRRIVLETELLKSPGKLRLILLHEIFHFVWPRLGNRRRGEFAAILRNEASRGARYELGESSAAKKEQIGLRDRGQNTRLWRDYVCESFCDTAACCFAGVASTGFRIAERWRKRREVWLRSVFSEERSC
jgi:hypothetical protein